jgi:hypothetical protein
MVINSARRTVYWKILGLSRTKDRANFWAYLTADHRKKPKTMHSEISFHSGISQKYVMNQRTLDVANHNALHSTKTEITACHKSGGTACHKLEVLEFHKAPAGWKVTEGRHVLFFFHLRLQLVSRPAGRHHLRKAPSLYFHTSFDFVVLIHQQPTFHKPSQHIVPF